MFIVDYFGGQILMIYKPSIHVQKMSAMKKNGTLLSSVETWGAHRYKGLLASSFKVLCVYSVCLSLLEVCNERKREWEKNGRKLPYSTENQLNRIVQPGSIFFAYIFIAACLCTAVNRATYLNLVP